MKRTTILADESLLLEIKQLGDEMGKGFSEIVREALEDYVRVHRKKRKPISFIGLGRSGHSDVSSRAEEILEEDVDSKVGWS